MANVAVLPSAVADQIAAGEVVERPASVVKELVENALDAGATVIDVSVDEGGRALIRVSDNGIGMGREDAQLSLARHATSKIRTVDDLVGIASFGFRGEALPAIASVSHFVLETVAGTGTGTRVRVDGGTVRDVSDVAHRSGTTVAVSHLFYNVPARLKFMRSARSEWRAIAEVLGSIALTRRQVHFTLTHGGKRILTLPRVDTLRARVGALWGATYADALLDVDDVLGEVAVSGLVERPSDVGTRTRRVHLAVNGRVIRDPGIVRAAEAAYRSTLPPGLRPALVLEVVVSADTVDVNVHPAKAEVRFRDRWSVERAVEQAVRRALGSLDSATPFNGVRAPVWHSSQSSVHVWSPPTRGEATTPFPSPFLPANDFDASESQVELAPPVSDDEIVVPPLTQLHRTYLIFERDDGLVLIDQHSAHERILYEKFMADLSRGSVPSQRLLLPITLHLGAETADAFEAHRPTFERLGFEAEPFGGHSLLVHSVPAPHPRFDAQQCLQDTLHALTGDRIASTASQHERLAATVACKAAVKAGDKLDATEMAALYRGLARTTLPAHDVHGRSTVVFLSWEEVERRFGRR